MASVVGWVRLAGGADGGVGLEQKGDLLSDRSRRKVVLLKNEADLQKPEARWSQSYVVAIRKTKYNISKSPKVSCTLKIPRASLVKNIKRCFQNRPSYHRMHVPSDARRPRESRNIKRCFERRNDVFSCTCKNTKAT